MKATEQYFPDNYAMLKKVFLIRNVTKYVKFVNAFRRLCLIPAYLPDFRSEITKYSERLN